MSSSFISISFNSIFGLQFYKNSILKKMRCYAYYFQGYQQGVKKKSQESAWSHVINISTFFYPCCTCSTYTKRWGFNHMSTIWILRPPSLPPCPDCFIKLLWKLWKCCGNIIYGVIRENNKDL